MHAQPIVIYRTYVNGHLVTLERWVDGHVHATTGVLTVCSQEPVQALAGLLSCPPFADREHAPKVAA